MIKARFSVTKTGNIKLSVTGHSRAADEGKDIVCASASMLAYTIAQVIKDCFANDMLQTKPEIILQPGNAKICCKPKEAYFTEVYHSFFVVQTGMVVLAHNYPEFVRTKTFGETLRS